MNAIRKPSREEYELIKMLVLKVTIKLPINWENELRVRSLSDGEMGSLALFPYGEVLNDRKMGVRISEHQFQDADGVAVIASLNLDSSGELFELDIWKTDFSSLIRFPDKLNNY